MNISCTFSGMLKMPECKDAPLVVVKAGELAFQYCDDPLVMRARIDAFTQQLLALPPEMQAEMPTQHQYVDGLYIRKMLAKKGEVIVGKIHRKPCLNFVESGEISVATETGMARVKPGFNVVSPAGIQKVGIAHEDTVFVNVFRTDLDPQKLGWDEFLEEVEKEIACERREDVPALAKGEPLCQLDG